MAPPKRGKTLIGLDIDDLSDQAGGVHISEEEIDAAFDFFDVDHSVRRHKSAAFVGRTIAVADCALRPSFASRIFSFVCRESSP